MHPNIDNFISRASHGTTQILPRLKRNPSAQVSTPWATVAAWPSFKRG